jgi:succinate dehydrogenase / fumarate reductase, membrane anchor subunit
LKTLRSPLGRVLGTGPAKEGVSHWWVQRLTSVALVPLSVWFLVSLLALPAFDHATIITWMSGTWTALFLILFLLISTWHSNLGLQVVIEDYVHGGTKTITIVLVTFIHVLLGAAGTFAILKVAFGSSL